MTNNAPRILFVARTWLSKYFVKKERSSKQTRERLLWCATGCRQGANNRTRIKRNVGLGLESSVQQQSPQKPGSSTAHNTRALFRCARRVT